MENNEETVIGGAANLVGVFILSKMLWNYAWMLESNPRMKQKENKYLANKLRSVKEATDKITRPAEQKLKAMNILNPIEDTVAGYHDVTDLAFQLTAGELLRVKTLCQKIIKERSPEARAAIINNLKEDKNESDKPNL